MIKKEKASWNIPKLITISAKGGKTQSGGTESIGCPEVQGEHFFGPARHRVTIHTCASGIAGTVSQINATTNSQIGAPNVITTSPGPS